MISVIGWGLIIGGIWIAREMAHAEEQKAAPQPVPVRNHKRRRRR